MAILAMPAHGQDARATSAVARPSRPVSSSRAGRPSKTVFSFSEGGPRQAYSPAVAGRMWGHFRAFRRKARLKKPSCGHKGPPIDDMGKCRGTGEGARKQQSTGPVRQNRRPLSASGSQLVTPASCRHRRLRPPIRRRPGAGKMPALRPCAMAILAMPEHGQGCPWHVRRGTAVSAVFRFTGGTPVENCVFLL